MPNSGYGLSAIATNMPVFTVTYLVYSTVNENNKFITINSNNQRVCFTLNDHTSGKKVFNLRT